MGRLKGRGLTWENEGFKANTFDLIRQDGEIRQLEPSDEAAFKGLSRQYFEKLNVHENRAIAQRIGLDAATSLPKKELVNRLVDKVWGIQFFTAGYTPIDSVDINRINAEAEIDLLETIKRGDVIIGTETEGVYFSRDRGGILYDVDNGNFHNITVDTCVPRNLVGEFSLKDGDYIKGRSKLIKDAGLYALFKIDEINGKSTANVKPTKDPLPRTPSVPISFDGDDRLSVGLRLFAPVCYGQFGLITTNSRFNFNDMAISLFESINENDCTKNLFVLSQKENEDEKLKKIDQKKGVVYSSVFGDTKTCFVLKNVLDYAKAQAKASKKHFVFVISDLDDVYESNGEGLSPEMLSQYAGCYEGAGSVTIIAIASVFSPLGAYHSVRNKLDFELVLKAGHSITENTIDMLSSYSFSDRTVSKEEAVATAKLKQLAVTDGIAAVERRIMGYGTAQEIINQLNN